MALIESGKSFDKEEHYQNMKKKMSNLEVSQYTLRIPTSVYKKLKVKLAKEGNMLSVVLNKMIEDYVNT